MKWLITSLIIVLIGSVISLLSGFEGITWIVGQSFIYVGIFMFVYICLFSDDNKEDDKKNT